MSHAPVRRKSQQAMAARIANAASRKPAPAPHRVVLRVKRKRGDAAVENLLVATDEGGAGEEEAMPGRKRRATGIDSVEETMAELSLNRTVVQAQPEFEQLRQDMDKQSTQRPRLVYKRVRTTEPDYSSDRTKEGRSSTTAIPPPRPHEPSDGGVVSTSGGRLDALLSSRGFNAPAFAPPPPAAILDYMCTIPQSADGIHHVGVPRGLEVDSPRISRRPDPRQQTVHQQRRSPSYRTSSCITMKTSIPVALGATCLGLQLTGNHQADGFVIIPAGSAGRGSQYGREESSLAAHHSSSIRSSSRGPLLQQKRKSPISCCRSTTCRCMMSKGFGQGDAKAAAGKTSKGGKGKDGLSIENAAQEATTKGNSEEETERKGTGQRLLFMQFTCNQCEGVSQYMINKNAYDDGIVICTCQSCGVRHLIADNLKKLDFPAFGNNIEEYMQSTGNPDEVKKGRAPDLTPEIIEKYDVVMGTDGVLTLSPKEGVVDGVVDEDASSSS